MEMVRKGCEFESNSDLSYFSFSFSFGCGPLDLKVQVARKMSLVSWTLDFHQK